MTRLVHYLRDHALATVALVCSLLALGSASYAAFSVPAGSIGARELKNHSITPVKFDPRTIPLSVRAWAHVDADGKVTDGSAGTRASSVGGRYTVFWPVKAQRRCWPVVTLDESFSGSVPAARSATATAGRHGSQLAVFGVTFEAGQPAPGPFFITVLCA